MSPGQPYLSLLVALDAALLLVVAGVAKKQLDWKQPAVQPVSRGHRGRARRPTGKALPRWTKPVALVAYVAAVLVVLTVTR